MNSDKYHVTAYILSIFAIILSIIAIFFSITSLSNKSLQADWASVLVGVLGALATILIGWQLFNVISFERRIVSLENKIKADIKDELEIVKEEARRFTILNTRRSMYINYKDNKQYKKAFHSLILSITTSLKLKRLNHDESNYTYQLKQLNKLIDSGNIGSLTIDKQYSNDKIDSYCNSLLSLKSEKALPIINYLQSLK